MQFGYAYDQASSSTSYHYLAIVLMIIHIHDIAAFDLTSEGAADFSNSWSLN